MQLRSRMRSTDENDSRNSSEEDECDHSSNNEDNHSFCSSSDGEYSNDESQYSDDSDSQASYSQETLYQHTSRSVVRRRAVSPPDSLNRDEASQARDEPTRSRTTAARNRRNRGRSNNPNFFQECFYFYADACPLCCNRRANLVLFLCISLWLAALFHDALPQHDPMTAIRKQSADVRARLRNEKMSGGRIGQPPPGSDGFWQQAQAKLQEILTHPEPRKPHNRKKEALAPGCKRPAWQSLSFPNCNQIHEFNLEQDLGLRRRRRGRMEHSNTTTMNTNDDSFGYVGAGLWRNVWKIRQGPDQQPVVLKMMKGEHDVDSRNMDRHRRDALSMERLTSSPNIVDIYGHCGNTVLTEYLPRGLDTLVYHYGGDKDDTTASRHTRLGRLRLALHVARGLAAIHGIPGGPIIHADIQAKQFLVDSNGIVKLNDFNRCRFASNNTKTGKPCTFTIPSAPGSSRAPEEYKYDDLTEKLDVFSMAHVLFAILTGVKPWEDLWGSKIKQLVKAGRKPPIREKKYLELGTSDAALANLIDLAYEVDPRERVSASQLVTELERLVAAEEAKQKIGNHPPT